MQELVDEVDLTLACDLRRPRDSHATVWVVHGPFFHLEPTPLHGVLCRLVVVLTAPTEIVVLTHPLEQSILIDGMSNLRDELGELSDENARLARGNRVRK